MKLQTCVPIFKSDGPIDYKDQLLLLGSCFATHIGNKLSYYKFKTLQNPLGILFHPKALELLIERAVDESYFQKEDIFFLNEQWHCFDAHSDLSNAQQEVLLESLNKAIEKTKHQLNQASHIVITLGTAWVYRSNTSGKLVANCHKVPQKEFSKELLSIETISAALEKIIGRVSGLNSKVRFIFTVSPVRHLKDGFVENQTSKAHLLAAVQEVINTFENQDRAFYFPAYEIMMDELRDYRFYKTDMVHPNKLAIDYIWERFTEAWLAEHVLPVMQKVEEIQKGLDHRPFNPNSQSHQDFLKSLQKKISYIKKDFPFMDFDI